MVNFNLPANRFLSKEELLKIDAYWRAANYLSVGQIYLVDNPLLRRPLEASDVKKRLLGHWGTTPGLNFIYVHLNRLIKKFDLNMIFLTGPGHGGPALVANTYLEGSYTEFYPHITEDLEGMQKLFKQFSFPGGIPSHAAAETPGSIHEGGELGYVLAHGFGAVFDNPNLIACCVIGDGEAETGPLAASWHSNKFLNAAQDGAVLPILHLNGYKIANPAVLARIPQDELESLLKGYGYCPYFVEGSDPLVMHELMAETLEKIILEIQDIQRKARVESISKRPLWPMLVLKTPKGWTGPKEIEGKAIENSWRSHQEPFSDFKGHPERYILLENWLKSYKPEELFDKEGRLKQEIKEIAPKGKQRMGASPHANGGLLLKDLDLPDIRQFALPISKPGQTIAESAQILGTYLRDVMKLNEAHRNFRVMGPDETASNRLQALFEVTDRNFSGEILPTDDHLSIDGRVMEILSEHLCQGWLEGYLLTGRHGFFSCYEAFIHIIDSMFNQHAKWLKVSRNIPWRKPIASLNYFLTSHVWRQDHNGFSHQDPGFIDVVMNKKSEVIRVYLPPDANTLLCVTNHCLKSKNYVNVIIAGKQPALQYLSMEEARKHCEKGASIWHWASNNREEEADVVLACAGDVPTMEILAAASLLREWLPLLKVQVVNIVDLMVLQPQSEHPHGLSDEEYQHLFTKDKPIIFAFHGYPWLIHRMTYKRPNHDNLHVRGYKEEGTTTTAFDMTVLNDLDRYHLVIDTLERLPPKFEKERAAIKKKALDKLKEHKAYIQEVGEDLPEIQNWKWEP